MTRDEVLQILRDHMDEFRRDYDVKELALFGSVARGENGESSDVDVLVEFAGKPRFHTYMNLIFRLEEIFGCHVDLVRFEALRPELRERVLGEAMHVA